MYQETSKQTQDPGQQPQNSAVPIMTYKNVIHQLKSAISECGQWHDGTNPLPNSLTSDLSDGKHTDTMLHSLLSTHSSRVDSAMLGEVGGFRQFQPRDDQQTREYFDEVLQDCSSGTDRPV